MRSKEEAQDYRYFPDPDLMTVNLDAAWVEKIKSSLPELSEQKKTRLVAEFGLSPQDAAAIASSKHVATIFENTVKMFPVKTLAAKPVANLLTGEITR